MVKKRSASWPRKIPAKRNLKIEVKNNIFSRLKITESYTSLILGAIVVLIVAILFVFFAKGNRNMQTSSVSEEQAIKQNSEEANSKTSSTYTVKPGDDLWSISENVYKNGYNWVEIAKVNKIENPGLINAGNKLIIPKIEKKEPIVIQYDKSTQEQNKVVANNAISGTTYTIKEGDNLWDICVRAYGDGFKWAEIAKANNIPNPDLIYPNSILNLPR